MILNNRFGSIMLQTGYCAACSAALAVAFIFFMVPVVSAQTVTNQATPVGTPPAEITPDDSGMQPAVPDGVERQTGKLYFSFVSSAYYMEKHWGRGMALEGIRRVADIAHSNGIPVTWMINAKSAQAAGDLFTQYHNTYGDEVGLILSANQEEAEKWGGESFYMRRTLNRDKMLKWAQEEIAGIKKSLPWAEIKIGGSGYRSKAMIQIFEKLGLAGVWGHCWEQTYTDGISDRGAPWGFYYVNPDAYKTPNSRPGGLVAIEWTARDLNLAFRTGKPETFSTDPDDVRRGGITSHRSIDYWKALVTQYQRNARYNAVAPLMVHQEAHEMECTDAVCANNQDVIDVDAEMLDELFKYVRETGAEIVPASQAIAAYRATNASTPPTYALFKNLAPSFKEMNPAVYEEVAGYREIFVYYDSNGQLFFDSGTVGPSFVRNYMNVSSAAMDDAEVAGIEYPPVPAVREQVLDGKFIYQVTVESEEKMPYGIALWGDFDGCRFTSAGLPGQKILSGALAFSPVIIEPGNNEIQIILECTGPAWE